MFTYTDFTKNTLMILTNFVHYLDGLYESILQYFPSHGIIGSLEVYIQLKYCLIVLPFVL
jgi:hypothetical protein